MEKIDTSPSDQAKALTDGFLLAQLQQTNRSSRGAFGVAGRGLIATAMLVGSGLLIGAMITTSMPVVLGITAGVGATLLGLGGLVGGINAYALHKKKPILDDFKKFESQLSQNPDLKNDLVHEVEKNINNNKGVNFPDSIVSVGKRHGMFKNRLNSSSWQEAVQSEHNRTPSKEFPGR